MTTGAAIERSRQLVKMTHSAINIGKNLQGIGLASDIALHQGFEIVARWTDELLETGSEFHDIYLREVVTMYKAEAGIDVRHLNWRIINSAGG